MNDKLDKRRYLKRIIIVSWICLFVCFLVKLFGGNFFNIVCNNERFIQICELADQNIFLNYVLGLINTLICLYFFNLAILMEPKYKRWQLFVLILTAVLGTALKLQSIKMGFLYDIWQGILMPVLLLQKDYKGYIRILLANILLISFQLLSIFTKSISIIVVYDGMLTTLIFSIDVIIMIVIYYLYSILYRKEKKQ